MYKKYLALLDKTHKTSYQVSKDTGIAQSVLSDWKRGRSNPKINKLKNLPITSVYRLSIFWSEKSV